MSDVEDDRFLQAMALAVFAFAALAFGTAVVHIAFRHGFRLAMVTFVAVIEYSLLMVVYSIIAAGLCVWDMPFLSLSDLETAGADLDWEDDDEEGGES